MYCMEHVSALLLDDVSKCNYRSVTVPLILWYQVSRMRCGFSGVLWTLRIAMNS